MLLEECFELRNRFEVLGTAGRTLHADEGFEIEAATVDPVHVYDRTVGEQVLVRAAGRDLTEEVDVSDVSLKREVQAMLHRGCIPTKWQSGRCPPQVRMIRRQGED